MNKSIYYLFVILLFTAYSCNNDDIEQQPIDPISEEEKDLIFETENFGQQSNGNFLGLISDEEGNQLSDVQITIGNSITTTDANGVFLLNEASIFENFAHIKAKKEGYIFGSRVVIPKEDGVNQIRIVLLEKTIIGSVNSGESSEISLPNGSKVTFEGAFIDSNGNAYNGQVDVSMHYLDPNSRETFNKMPGSLFAQNENNDARSLETYGMLSVNLYSPSGEQLNISENTVSTLEFPIADSQLSIAPETIELWYFDEDNGYWKEDGLATKNGNKYTAEVSHFTWWNCDLPLETILFCFTTNAASASTNYVEITRVRNHQSIYSGHTFFDGGLSYECGRVVINEEIEVKIYGTDACDNVLIYEGIHGPYSVDTMLTIDLPLLTDTISNTLITGNALNCIGNPITNGYFFLDFNNLVSITDGTINYNFPHCTTEPINLIIYDSDANQFSNVITITPNGTSIDIGTESTCNMPGGTYNGDVFLESQEQVDAFSAFGFADIVGNLVIGLEDEPSDINDISALSTIETITGYLVIKNTDLINLQGVENITTVSGGLSFYSNDNLLTANEFTSLTSFAGLFHFYDNDSLTTIDFLGINTVEYLYIGFNASLTTVRLNDLVTVNDFFWYVANPVLPSIGEYNSITNIGGNLLMRFQDALINLQGLSNLQSAGSVDMSSNPGLTSYEGLDSLTDINGDANFYLNSGLVDFDGFNSVTTVGGDLSFYDNEMLNSINGFNNLITIDGDLIIDTNIVLTSFDGLNSLQSINDEFNIVDNNELTSLAGFSSLASISTLSVENNDALTSLIDLNAVTSLGRLDVEENDGLLTFSTFNNLTVLNKISIKNNATLSSLQELENITTIADWFTLIANPQIVSLQPLSNVSGFVDVIIIENNDALIDLTGLENIISVGDDIVSVRIMENNSLLSVNGLQGMDFINVVNNINLSDFCSFQIGYTNGVDPDTIFISGNAYNPSVQDIIDGNCSL